MLGRRFRPIRPPGLLDRSTQEGLYPRVNRGTEPQHLAPADPIHAHSLDQLEMPWTRNRESSCLAQLRDPQPYRRACASCDRGSRYVLRRLGAVLAALAVTGAAQRLRLQLHQPLSSKAQQRRIGTLLHQLAKGDHVVSDRGGLQGQSCAATQPYPGAPRWLPLCTYPQPTQWDRTRPDHRSDATALHQPAMRSWFPHPAGPLEDRDKILRAVMSPRSEKLDRADASGQGRGRKHNSTPPEIAAPLRGS
jgi:hypothetical protein